MYFNLAKPIPDEIKDPKDLYEWFGEHRLIPYFGRREKTSHLLLELMETLCDMAPTFKSCIRARNAYTFGLNLNVVGRAYPGLAGETVEVEYDRQVEFATMLQQDLDLPLTKITKLSKLGMTHRIMSGNAYLRILRTVVGGESRYQFKMLHYKQCVYRKSDDPGERFIVHSKFITDPSKLSEHPPAIYRVTEVGEALRWMTVAPGTEAAVIHIRNEDSVSEGEYYSRTDILSVLTWLYVEYQMGNHESKVAYAEFVSKILILMEAENSDSLPDPELVKAEDGTNPGKGGKQLDTFQRNMIVLKEITTSMDMKGTKLGPKAGQAAMAGIEYPNGTKAPTSINLDIDRDTTHHEFQLSKAAAYIASACGWSVDLTSLRQAKATLGGNLLYDTFEMKNTETIQPEQIWWENFWNDIIAQLCELEGASSEFKGFGINFPNVIEELLGRLRSTGGNVGAVRDPAEDESFETPENDEDDDE